MAVCPCCRESLPSAAGSDELCEKCARALETGADNSPSTPGAQPVLDSTSGSSASEQEIAQPEKPRLPRPLIITILALQQYLAALGCLIVAIYGLIKLRLDLILFALFFAWLTYALASGLWRLKNWARWIMVCLFLLDLLGGEPYVLFPFYKLLGGDPIGIICGRVVTVMVIVYLLSPRVDGALGVAPLNLKWRLVVGFLALALFIGPLTQVEHELAAIKWHMRHGNRVTVNGVSFPIARWQVPTSSSDWSRLEIEDMPGPLRPDDRLFFMTIAGRIEDENGEPQPNRTQSPAELVDLKNKSYQKAGYTDLRKFQMKVRGQTLECIEETMYGHTVYCYGDGPIYSIFFTGSDHPWDEFNRMIAEAR